MRYAELFLGAIVHLLEAPRRISGLRLQHVGRDLGPILTRGLQEDGIFVNLHSFLKQFILRDLPKINTPFGKKKLKF